MDIFAPGISCKATRKVTVRRDSASQGCPLLVSAGYWHVTFSNGAKSIELRFDESLEPEEVAGEIYVLDGRLNTEYQNSETILGIWNIQRIEKINMLHTVLR